MKWHMVTLSLLMLLLLFALAPSGAAQPGESAPLLPFGFETEVYTETARLAPAGAQEYEAFGLSTALDCESYAPDCTAVIGAPYALSAGKQTGVAYIFERQADGPWVETARLVASDAAEGAGFGNSVAIYSDTVAIGAPGADASGVDSGAAYIFERNEGGPGAWGQVIRLLPDDTAKYDSFGRAVALRGDTLVAGAHAKPPGGSAYVFERNLGGPDNWGQALRLAGHNTDWGDAFGVAVDIDGDSIIVGAHAGGNYIGQAYIFERDAVDPYAWSEVAWLTADDGYAYDYFGYAVAISGEIAAVGAPGDEGLTGAVYVFLANQGSPGGWGQAAKLTASDAAPHSNFGLILAAQSNLVLVGSPKDYQMTDSAYLFRCTIGTPIPCVQETILLPSDPAPDAEFSYGPDISNGTLIAGAPGAAPGGAAYIFELVNTPPNSLELTLSEPAILEGATITVTAAFADLEPGDTHTLTLSWGDGLSETVFCPLGVFTATLSRPVSDDLPSVTPADLLPLTLTISDTGGASAWITASLLVSNVAPLVDAGSALTLTVGEALTRTGGFFDPGADSWAATVDYGAGAGPQPLTLSGSTYQLYYVYTQPGIYQVTITITDDDSGVGIANFTVTVLSSNYTVYLPIALRE